MTVVIGYPIGFRIKWRPRLKQFLVLDGADCVAAARRRADVMRDELLDTFANDGKADIVERQPAIVLLREVANAGAESEIGLPVNGVDHHVSDRAEELEVAGFREPDRLVLRRGPCWHFPPVRSAGEPYGGRVG